MQNYQSPPMVKKKVKIHYSSKKQNQSDYNPESDYVSDFNLEFSSSSLSKLMSDVSLEEKENQHSTDRFIPLRKHTSANVSAFTIEDKKQDKIVKGQQVKDNKITLDQIYRSLLLEKNVQKTLFFGENQQKNEKFTSKKMTSEGLFNENKIHKKTVNQYRKVSKAPFKVLDAPNLQDDFYLNLLEWSSQNILSVALDSSLYFWNANNNKVVRFCDTNLDSISSIHWNLHGSHIAVGTSRGSIEIWDVTKNCKSNEYYQHASRVSSMAWAGNILASGSRDRSIQIRDLREDPSVSCKKYEGHTQQVCGLKWSFDESLLASGGNDNKLFVWSNHSTNPVGKFSNHCAAVKGIAWSPHNHGVLASGGGSADKTIKFWNTLNNTLIDSIDTGSQVCNIMFSKNTKQLVSTHGFSNNQIIIWKYPSLRKLTTLTGHTHRVLFLAMNPSGQTIVTGAGDETLRFWNAFPEKSASENKSNFLSSMELR